MAMVQQVDMAVKANEILSRFRPIAPKPALPMLPAGQAGDGAAVVVTNRVLCQLHSRPCRARKRRRPSVVPVSPPAAAKRKRAPAYPAPLRCVAATDAVVATTTRVHVSVAVPGSACLPLASFSPASAGSAELTRLSPMVAVEEARDIPVERDLLRKLLEPKVISPRAVRPVGSTIHVESVVHDGVDVCRTAGSMMAQEVEAELEADALPAVISDSSNRVRLVNDAYKKMVGQPECPWLDAVAAAAAASRRISGEVELVVAEPATLPQSRGGFSCTAKIEWERDGKRASISAPCDVSRVQCESRDYIFTWRFRTTGDAPVNHRTGDA